MPDAPLPPLATPPQPDGASDRQIVVDSTSGPAQLTSALRTLFTVIGTSAGVLGYPHLDTWLGQAAIVIGPLIAVVAIILGQIHIRKAARQQVVMANKLPNADAVVVDSRILK